MKKGFVDDLVGTYIRIAIIPILAVAIIAAAFITANSIKTQERNIKATTELLATQTESIMDTMSFISIQLAGQIMSDARDLDIYADSPIKAQKAFSSIKTSINSFAIQSSVYTVVYFDRKGHYIRSSAPGSTYSYEYQLPSEETDKLTWLEQADTNGGKAILLPMGNDQIPLYEEPCVCLVRAIRDPGKVVGYVCVMTEQSFFDELFAMCDVVDASAAITEAGSGEILYEYDRNGFWKEGIENASADMPYFFVDTVTKGDCSMTVISSRVRWGIKTLRRTVLSVLLALAPIALAVLFIRQYSQNMSNALRLLKDQMDALTLDDLNHQKKPGEKEIPYRELAYLYAGYGRMQKRLQEMIQREIVFKTQQIQERLNSLQAQINPHFLYNTLNVVGIMGIESNNLDIYTACLDLSSLLRYSIADKNPMDTTIQNEIQHVEQYLKLMKLRYEHKMEYVIEMEPLTKETVIPRLVLQPFVENIFEHAFHDEHRKVQIHVRAKRQKEGIQILIEDDGQGMGKAQLQEMDQEIRERICNIREEIYVAASGIGIENTLHRLRLFYGERFQYELRSEPGKGFHVSLQIGDAEHEQSV